MSTGQFARFSEADDEADVAPPRRRSRDISGGVLLLIAGAAGLLSWLGPWSATVGSVTGSSVSRALAGVPEHGSWSFCIRAVAIIGVMDLVIGLALMIKTYLRRYLGGLAMLGAMVAIALELYYLIQAGFDFAGTSYGYWAFVGFGLVSLIAALKTLGTP